MEPDRKTTFLFFQREEYNMDLLPEIDHNTRIVNTPPPSMCGAQIWSFSGPRAIRIKGVGLFPQRLNSESG